MDGIFTSKTSEYIFYLTKLDGKQRNDLLGITDSHYINKTLAKQWYDSILDYIKLVGNKEAEDTLVKLYLILIEDD